MKKLPFITFIAIISIAFYSCSKSQSNTPKASTVTVDSWTINGRTYKAPVPDSIYTQGGISGKGGYVVVLDTSNNYAINLAIPYFPTSNSTYKVGDGTKDSVGYCSISVDSVTQIYSSIAKDGDQIQMTVTDSSITASFTNITVEDVTSFAGFTTVSGIVTFKVRQ